MYAKQIRSTGTAQLLLIGDGPTLSDLWHVTIGSFNAGAIRLDNVRLLTIKPATPVLSPEVKLRYCSLKPSYQTGHKTKETDTASSQ